VLILALTAHPALRRPAKVRGLVALQVGMFVGIVVLGVAGLMFPHQIPAVPRPKSAPAELLFGIGGTALLLLITRAVRTYRLTRRTADLAVAVGCSWLGVTLYANLILGFGTFAFYIGHPLEIAAVAFVGLPAALDIKRAGASRPLVGDLTATELVAGEEAYLGPRVRALMIRLERRDVSTEEHTRRVALLAAQVGEELKLSPSARRHLAVGGLLHDIGKLSVPLEILNKPGKLTDAEFGAIKRHPGDGRKLLEELGGFPEPIHGLVSDHHERLDGSGYPRGLTAGELSVETRILAVVDVYDALVSNRVYRAAWSPERAFGLLDDESHAYDQTVVAALKRVVAPFVADVAAPAPARARLRVPRTV
jgi:HD-GYP domain-containing protein (c-di-GMP phosphodiesterase class II)